MLDRCYCTCNNRIICYLRQMYLNVHYRIVSGWFNAKRPISVLTNTTTNIIAGAVNLIWIRRWHPAWIRQSIIKLAVTSHDDCLPCAFVVIQLFYAGWRLSNRCDESWSGGFNGTGELEERDSMELENLKGGIRWNWRTWRAGFSNALLRLVLI